MAKVLCEIKGQFVGIDIIYNVCSRCKEVVYMCDICHIPFEKGEEIVCLGKEHICKDCELDEYEDECLYDMGG
ncbi:MAG: hypothetical protein M0R17_07265 [Candidatus Omnitrophica bacterium]|jgi:hypothetical protein|nr:hypothetical protein [Candidatus Omnitrophota bacterium]